MENAWLTSVEGSQGYRLARKLDATRRDLKRWNKNCFGISRERIKELEAKIARLQVSNPPRENLELEASLNWNLMIGWKERILNGSRSQESYGPRRVTRTQDSSIFPHW